MKATLNGGSGEQPTVTVELTLEEAKALDRVLGSDGVFTQMARGVSRKDAEVAYTIFDKLNDVVVASEALEGL